MSFIQNDLTESNRIMDNGIIVGLNGKMADSWRDPPSAQKPTSGAFHEWQSEGGQLRISFLEALYDIPENQRSRNNIVLPRRG
jgi:hypothetical protein